MELLYHPTDGEPISIELKPKKHFFSIEGETFYVDSIRFDGSYLEVQYISHNEAERKNRL